MKPFARAAALLAAVLLPACEPGTQSQPTPGVLTVSLAALTPGDRAVVISIAGPTDAADVQPAQPTLAAYARSQGGVTRVAVFGALAEGPVLRFSVPDTRQAGQYQATVIDAADGSNTARGSLLAYRAVVERGEGVR